MTNLRGHGCGAEEIRTSAHSPEKTACLGGGGAESGALAASDPDLATLLDLWPMLPDGGRKLLRQTAETLAGTPSTTSLAENSPKMKR